MRQITNKEASQTATPHFEFIVYQSFASTPLSLLCACVRTRENKIIVFIGFRCEEQLQQAFQNGALILINFIWNEM